MGKGAWNGHGSMGTGSRHASLPSFQELLSIMASDREPTTDSLGSASTFNTSNKFTETIPQVENNAIAIGFIRHERTFQLQANDLYTPLFELGHTSSSLHCGLRTTGVSDAVSSPFASQPAISRAQKRPEIEHAPARGPITASSANERKVWREQTTFFPFNENMALTKSGMLRKRLRKACNTCREKKVNALHFDISLDPDGFLR